MSEAFSELYEGYLLRCAPHPTPDGRFLASLVISFAESNAHKDVVLTPDAPSFSSARDAADFSLTEGKRWVKQNT